MKFYCNTSNIIIINHFSDNLICMNLSKPETQRITKYSVIPSLKEAISKMKKIFRKQLSLIKRNPIKTKCKVKKELKSAVK